MDTWRGHFPITSFVLLALLKKAQAGFTEFSREERILFTSCEFWAATAARDLAAYLGLEAEERLRAAHDAFTALGAVHVARTLNMVTRDFRSQHLVKWGETQVRSLESQLLATEDPVDKLIAEYASDRILNDSQSDVK
jgi:hypothetical protein